MNAPDRQNGSMIAVHGLVKTIGAGEILRGVDLDVARARRSPLLGAAAAAKAFLLKHSSF